MPYQYVRSLNLYREVATGRFVAKETVMGYVMQVISAGDNKGYSIATLYSTGQLSADDYGRVLKQSLKETYLQQYMLGRGGKGEMTQKDYGALGYMLRVRYQEINNYVAEIKQREDSGIPYTLDYLSNRNRLYYESSRQAYERGNSEAYGLPLLPAYPADGSTLCVSGCRCFWRIEKVAGGFDCFWEIVPGKNCKTCLDRNRLWYPLQVRDGIFVNFVDVRK